MNLNEKTSLHAFAHSGSVMEVIDVQESLFETAEAAPEVRPDLYSADSDAGQLIRTVRTRAGETRRSIVPFDESTTHVNAEAAFDAAWLRSKYPPRCENTAQPLRVVDLFAGCGAMSLGVAEAARALQRPLETLLAVDFNARAVEVYKKNFSEADAIVASVEEVIDGELGSSVTKRESELVTRLGEVHLLFGGPPCQGHSDLNNRTRRSDPKNTLYARMARFAEVVRPRNIIIENVPGVVHDRGRVVQETHAVLHKLGYAVDTGVLHAVQFGVAQRRKRFFTVASLDVIPDLAALERSFRTTERSFTWACGDLADFVADTVFDSPSPASEVNRRRIDYLFEHQLYELPDSERPDCHRLKPHSYASVYGRIRPDEPVPTITSGFGSMGQGRFVHPSRKRTITPHEAARLQFIPDFFDFGSTPRHAMQEMIGNAVPPKLAFVLALQLLH